MTSAEAKKILESYRGLSIKIDVCDHILDLIEPFQDLRPSIKEACDRRRLDRDMYLRQMQRIRSAVEAIKDKGHRDLLRLRFIEGKRWPEVAQELWLSEASGAIRKARKAYALFAEQFDIAKV